jgi:Type IV secretion system pilin
MRYIMSRVILVLALITIAGIVGFAGAAIAVPDAASAVTKIDLGNLPRPPANDTRIQRALNVTFGILGGVSLIMVTIGGFRYISAQGDAKQAADAKSTIIYAMIGLIISMLAIVIVTYVVGRLT